jgi:hypothetical protein
MMSRVTSDETAMSSAEQAEVAAMKTMRRIAIAPPLPMIVAAAAGATRPAETCWALRAYGYVGKAGFVIIARAPRPMTVPKAA